MSGNGFNNKLGKSNNAVEAEENGFYDVYFLSKEFDLEVETIMEYFKPKKWHHVKANPKSNKFRKTFFVSYEEVEKNIGDPQLLELNKSIKKEKSIERTYQDCFVSLTDHDTGKTSYYNNAKVVVKNGKARIYSNLDDLTKMVIETREIIDEDFYYITSEQKKVIQKRIEPFAEKGLYFADHKDGNEHYGVGVNHYGECGFYKNEVGLKKVGKKEFTKAIFASGSYEESLKVLDDLENNESSYIISNRKFLASTNNPEKLFNKLKNSGFICFIEPTFNNINTMIDRSDKSKPRRQRYEELRTNGLFVTMSSRYFFNSYVKQPQSRGKSLEELTKCYMTEVLIKSGIGRIEMNDEECLALLKGMKNVRRKDIAQQQIAKNRFLDKLNDEMFVERMANQIFEKNQDLNGSYIPPKDIYKNITDYRNGVFSFDKKELNILASKLNKYHPNNLDNGVVAERKNTNSNKVRRNNSFR